jgi:mannose-6-phosphate isomerase-like protein (cupin superfamily)
MLIQRLHDCPEFLAGDSTRLRELLHPDKQDVALRYSLAHATVPPGRSSLKHRLATSEVYYILEGEGDMHIGSETARVRPGDAVYIPPRTTQWIENAGAAELRFICIVDPAWRVEDEVVEEAP